MALALTLLGALVTSCSLVTDFPEPQESASDPSTGDRDGGVTQGRCDPSDHSPCASDELCCDRQDGRGPRCVETSDAECSACGQECGAAAPFCNGRFCECTRNSKRECATGVCDEEERACVECTTDEQCTSRPGRTQCVNNVCVQCDRGRADDPTDDRGCGAEAPICNEDNRCIGCRGPADCPGGQCVQGGACSGCDPVGRIGENGCNPSNPVCKAGPNGLQCVGCETTEECAGGYCHDETGECINACDPDPQVGQSSNGCTDQAAGVCKRRGDGWACQPCSASADCKEPGKTRCAVAGALAGRCVGCLNNADCTGTGTFCDATGTCRAPTGQADCPAGQVFRNGACGPCTANADCAMQPAGSRTCNPTTRRCGPCSPAACMGTPTPFCDANTMDCVACRPGGADCGGSTPICANGACTPCTSNAQCAPPISPLSPRRQCVTSGPGMGSCAACNPVTNEGCGIGTACLGNEDPSTGGFACVTVNCGGEPPTSCPSVAPVCSILGVCTRPSGLLSL